MTLNTNEYHDQGYGGEAGDSEELEQAPSEQHYQDTHQGNEIHDQEYGDGQGENEYVEMEAARIESEDDYQDE